MSKPAFLPTLAAIPPKPNVIRSGLPLAIGSTVLGVLQPGPTPGYLGVEALINTGSLACYQFSDEYCYAGAPAQTAPGVSEAFALDLSNNQKTASMGAGAMTYGSGGIQFTSAGGTAIQAIDFNVVDVQPVASQADNILVLFWIGFNAGNPVPATNALLFTGPDGSTWSLVNGVFTFKPINQVAVSLSTITYTAGVPLQLGYAIELGSGSYTVKLFVNGQLAATESYAQAYVPPATWPTTCGFGPNTLTAADQFAYTVMRFYVEDLTISGNADVNVVAGDYLMNYTDMVSQFNTNALPTAP